MTMATWLIGSDFYCGQDLGEIKLLICCDFATQCLNSHSRRDILEEGIEVTNGSISEPCVLICCLL